MAEEHLSPDDERRVLEWFERSALTDYPNPDRIGCPGSDFLRRLAFNRKSIPLSHPALDHLPRCSPCFAEFVDFRNAARRQRLLRRTMAIAAGLVIVAAVAWLGLRARPTKTPPEIAQNQPGALADFRIDLQNRSVPRGDAPKPSEVPLKVPHQQLRLTIDLPFGSPPGRYEAEILANPDNALVHTSGEATLNAGVTTLRVEADLRQIAPGKYFLGIRRPPWDWTFVPIVLE